MQWNTNVSGSPAGGAVTGPWIPGDGSEESGVLNCVQPATVFLDSSVNGRTVLSTVQVGPGTGYQATAPLSDGKYYRVRYQNGGAADTNPILLGISGQTSTGAGPQGPPGPQGPTGAQGPAGAQGAAGAVGPAGLTWRGAYAAGTTYAQNDAVGFAGESWFSLVNANIGNQPDISPAAWALLASQGATGPAGPQGATGPQGPQGIPGSGGGGALTVQAHTVAANVAVGAGGNTAIFTDNFTVGTWLINVTWCFAAQAADAQCGIIMVAGTATVDFNGLTEADMIIGSHAESVTATFLATVTVAGTIHLQAFNGGAAGTNVIGGDGRSNYSAVKVA